MGLRLLSRFLKQASICVVKQKAAKDVVNGSQGQQQYYFDHATFANPPKEIVAYTWDHLQRKDVVRNQNCYLMVQVRNENPLSIDDFFLLMQVGMETSRKDNSSWWRHSILIQIHCRIRLLWGRFNHWAILGISSQHLWGNTLWILKQVAKFL